MYKNKSRLEKLQGGFSIAELIVVLSIFAVLASMVLFNYQGFLAKVNIKSLANDVALKLVEAQKNSTSGKQNSLASTTWKPSYGVYFDLATGANTGNKVFYYFADLDQDKTFDHGSYTCPSSECLEKISITKNNTISELRVVYLEGSYDVVQDLEITFTRPNSGADMRSSSSLSTNISYAQITVVSPGNSSTALVKIYASGRVQIN